jgi:F-type H+-transporting ATPase subunit alpha
MHAYLKDKYADLLAKLEKDRAMDKDAEAQLAAAVAEFKKTGTY